MTKQKIIEFIKKFTNKKIKVVITYNKNIKYLEAFVSFSQDKLTINKKFIEEASDAKVQESILHEIGHCLLPIEKSIVKNEYNAQLWAIKMAKNHRMKRVFLAAIKTVLVWKYSNWNLFGGQYRKYILASRLFKYKLTRLVKNAFSKKPIKR